MDLRTLSKTDQPQGQPGVTPAGAAGRVPGPRRRWVTRVALPVAIVLITLALIGYAARDLILPARSVEVVRVTALSGSPAESGTAGDSVVGPASVVAQAPGWVEPDPYPIYVSALADGVVREVLVLEGEAVTKGQSLVHLVEDDALLSLESARAELDRRRAALVAAETDFNEPVALRRADAVSKARVAEARAALSRLDAEVAKEEARLAELTAAYERLKAMTERSVSALQVDAAKYQAQSQQAVVTATRQRRPELEAQVEGAEADHAAAKRDLELKVQLRQQLDDATAAVKAAQVRVDEAELRLKRMTIKSPVDGVVMARLVSPGTKLMLASDQPHSAHPIHLYDPSKLQVRVDVPLADAAAVGVGQRAKIIVDVLPDVEFDGVVTRLVHLADIAKNTVQFKVAIQSPSALLKPDMLARVKFLSTGSTNSGAGGEPIAAGTSAVAIRRSAVAQGDEPAVWWVSPVDSRIERRAIKLGRELGDNRVVVRDGLNPGDVIINQPAADLQDGQRVRYGKTNAAAD